MTKLNTSSTVLSERSWAWSDLPDEQLLSRFLDVGTGDDRAAFETLVERHGPMVLSVCRRILGHSQDAEDAYQATFLTLAQKANSIRDGRALAAWLKGVAVRYASGLRTRQARRVRVEREFFATRPQSPAAGGEPSNEVRDEIAALIYEEVGLLPDRYKDPVVLCYLEGRTNEEVARLLSWPVGTVKGRLSRARELLRARLVRRGLAFLAAFLFRWLGRGRAVAEAADVSRESSVESGSAGSHSGLEPVSMNPARSNPTIRHDAGASVAFPAPTNASRRRRRVRRLILAFVIVIAGAFAAIAVACDQPAWALPLVGMSSSVRGITSENQSTACPPVLDARAVPESRHTRRADR